MAAKLYLIVLALLAVALIVVAGYFILAAFLFHHVVVSNFSGTPAQIAPPPPPPPPPSYALQPHDVLLQLPAVYRGLVVVHIHADHTGPFHEPERLAVSPGGVAVAHRGESVTAVRWEGGRTDQVQPGSSVDVGDGTRVEIVLLGDAFERAAYADWVDKTLTRFIAEGCRKDFFASHDRSINR